MHLTAKSPVDHSKRVQRRGCETLFGLPELGLRIDRPSADSAASSFEGTKPADRHRQPSRAETRLEQLARRDRAWLRKSFQDSPPTKSSQRVADPVGVTRLIDHAENLIDRLSEWSAELDQRESKLDQREHAIESQLRSLRQSSRRATG